MNAIFALLALGALMGLFFGRYFSWIAILVSAPILAVLSATVLQNEGFGFFTGIAIIVACLTVNQIAYWISLTLATSIRRTDKLPRDQPNDEPGESGHDDIGRQHEQQQTPSRGVPVSEQWR
jgi:hypothetical protein